MKRVFIIFFLCYTHYGFLRFISNDLQHVTKGNNLGQYDKSTFHLLFSCHERFFIVPVLNIRLQYNGIFIIYHL
jgi:hypothetical protein